jgi:hypothetical protein
VSAPILPDTWIDSELVNAIDTAIPCQWTEEEGSEIFECPCPAEWILRYRKVCVHGGMVPGPHIVMLCSSHKDQFLAECASGNWRCIGCNCRITSASHIAHGVDSI